MKKNYRQSQNSAKSIDPLTVSQQVSMKDIGSDTIQPSPIGGLPGLPGLFYKPMVVGPQNPFDVLRQRLTDTNNLGQAGQFFGVPDYNAAIENSVNADKLQTKRKKYKDRSRWNGQ